jgi:hypothetical protein
VVTLVVEVPHSTRDCAALDAAAEGFIRFARGGAAPQWAPEVELLLGYTRWDLMTASNADDPTAWSMCSGVAPADCVLSPLAQIRGAQTVETAESVTPGECEFLDRGGLPRGLSFEDAIHISPGKVECEGQFAVSLWVDDVGRIRAVNFLYPETFSSR